ncbi:BTB/POZ domain-containing protein 3-like [Phlebotomus papatasi]|uniref:BTB/POZ domain-containing protein 3-like n=1 Tax=Phlebotomus papatasi TaxID=29031 RepID=UPI002483C87D|nr:BTB/POZ domain-containing protein 3-like [Phlebotomus papatasi]
MADEKRKSAVKFGDAPDIKFIFPRDSGAILLAEKYRLADKSEVFRKLFGSSSGGQEHGEQISITDISYEMFRIMIRHIYNKVVEISEQNFLEILYASRKYFVETLTYMVIKFVMKFINEENLAKYFESIDKFQIKMLNDHMKKVCKASPLTIIKSLTCSEAHKRILEIILESSDLPCSEFELYSAIVKMLKSERGNGILSNEDLQKKLGKLVYLIRFPTMSIKELILCGKKPSLLTSQQIVDLLLWVQENTYSNSLQFFSNVPRKSSNKSSPKDRC